MKTRAFTLTLTLIPLLLAACAGAVVEAPAPQATTAPAVAEATVSQSEAEEVKPTAESSGPAFDTDSRLDEQGAVVVDVTPANLNSSGDTLDFGVGMNTHSVDLSMDLAALSTLTTDTGLTVEASTWSGEAGGHHVSGTLSFPATVDGEALLDGANVVTLTIREVDAAERVFVWKRS